MLVDKGTKFCQSLRIYRVWIINITTRQILLKRIAAIAANFLLFLEEFLSPKLIIFEIYMELLRINLFRNKKNSANAFRSIWLRDLDDRVTPGHTIKISTNLYLFEIFYRYYWTIVNVFLLIKQFFMYRVSVYLLLFKFVIVSLLCYSMYLLVPKPALKCRDVKHNWMLCSSCIVYFFYLRLVFVWKYCRWFCK